ncbi:tgb3 [Potexvirus ecsallii]|uniref:Movement protein TGBp3 n=1 Tax=Potexvirus ecsallii TaxID=317027 RepID=C0L9E4_9VIRU|nr:tgb3 [Allium virus X]ACN58197.1 tgb3 [Allium virus X]
MRAELLITLLSAAVTLLVLQVWTQPTPNSCYIEVNGHTAYTNCPPSPHLAQVVAHLKPHSHAVKFPTGLKQNDRQDCSHQCPL